MSGLMSWPGKGCSECWRPGGALGGDKLAVYGLLRGGGGLLKYFSMPLAPLTPGCHRPEQHMRGLPATEYYSVAGSGAPVRRPEHPLHGQPYWSTGGAGASTWSNLYTANSSDWTTLHSRSNPVSEEVNLFGSSTEAWVAGGPWRPRSGRSPRTGSTGGWRPAHTPGHG